MAPVATHPPSDDISKSAEKGPALVIGSLSTAQDGKYQRVVSELEATRQVERQMLDRLLDRGDALRFPPRCIMPYSYLHKLLFSRLGLTRRFISPFPLMIIKYCNPVYQSCFPYSTKDFHRWGHCTYSI
jgi:hypothetical protein